MLAPEPQPGPPPAAEPAPPPAAAAAAELPSIDSLGKDSDFSVFLREGVPEDTHRQALRKLWQSDPLLTAHDGLTDYAEDLSRIGIVPTLVRTAYQVGRGYLEAAAAADEKPAGTAAGQPPPADQAPPGDQGAAEASAETAPPLAPEDPEGLSGKT
jgi:hypothetical protein